ncbi:hypothetical protein JAAARDRAFT_194980 [Jaapia argillacea MUCL 33604]|uniref:Uncharacterized protein n=1 Tax=Jaapia argillacea MUCL 33604 TaxID=933084 RepID=A0A067PR84_9AGAM|nr:hypothetical protein JAAARDRAFT_194980 [Jaapia argillacea MUCL 33604]
MGRLLPIHETAWVGIRALLANIVVTTRDEAKCSISLRDEDEQQGGEVVERDDGPESSEFSPRPPPGGNVLHSCGKDTSVHPLFSPGQSLSWNRSGSTRQEQRNQGTSLNSGTVPLTRQTNVVSSTLEGGEDCGELPGSQTPHTSQAPSYVPSAPKTKIKVSVQHPATCQQTSFSVDHDCQVSKLLNSACKRFGLEATKYAHGLFVLNTLLKYGGFRRTPRYLRSALLLVTEDSESDNGSDSKRPSKRERRGKRKTRTQFGCVREDTLVQVGETDGAQFILKVADASDGDH